MDTNQVKNEQPFKITGNWEVQSKALKAKYAQLTDSDLKFEAGKESELLGRLASRLNKKQDEIVTIIQQVQPERA